MQFEYVAAARNAYDTLPEDERAAVDHLIDRLSATTGPITSDTPVPDTPFGPTYRHRAGHVRVLIAHTPDDNTAWILGFALRPVAV